MTNIAVDSIELLNQSSSLLFISNVTNLTELQYTIDLVMDDLQGEQFTCIAVAGDTKYNETVVIEVQGIKLFSCDGLHIPTSPRSVARGIPVARCQYIYICYSLEFYLGGIEYSISPRYILCPTLS